MSETRVVSFRQVRENFAKIVGRAEHEGSSTIITSQGKEVAAVVPIDLLLRYQQLEEEEILCMVKERTSNPESGIPVEQVMAEILEGPE